MPHSLFISKLVLIIYLTSFCANTGQFIIETPCVAVSYDVLAFREDAYFTVCGWSPRSSFMRRFIGKTSLSSPLLYTHTHENRHILVHAHAHTNMTACHHFRVSFYQPRLNIDPIDCLKPSFPQQQECFSPGCANGHNVLATHTSLVTHRSWSHTVFG